MNLSFEKLVIWSVCLVTLLPLSSQASESEKPAISCEQSLDSSPSYSNAIKELAAGRAKIESMNFEGHSIRWLGRRKRLFNEKEAELILLLGQDKFTELYTLAVRHHREKIQTVQITQQTTRSTRLQVEQNGVFKHWHEAYQIEPDLTAFKMSPDSKKIAMTFGSGSASAIKILALDTKKELSRIEVGNHRAYFIAFSQNGQFLATILEPPNVSHRFIQLWDLVRNKEVALLKVQFEIMKDVLVSNDGRFIFAQSIRDSLYKWDLAQNPQVSEFVSRANTFQMTPDGKSIVVQSNQSEFQLIPMDSGATKKFSVNNFSALSIDPSSQYIMANYEDGLGVWSLQDGEQKVLIPESEEDVHAYSWSPDGQNIITTTPAGIRGYDIKERRFPNLEFINKAQLAYDNKHTLLEGGRYGLIKSGGEYLLFDLKTGQLLEPFTDCKYEILSMDKTCQHFFMSRNEAGDIHLSIWSLLNYSDEE